MHKKLNEQMWAVAREYARLFGEIIGLEPEYCVADVPTDMWSFGDCLFFSLDEMRVVVDDIDKYIDRYGSREAVGQEIRDWVDWWLNDGMNEYNNYEYVQSRVTHQLRVNISLKAWLDGCPRDERKAWNGADADYLRLRSCHDMLEHLIDEFRENRTLGNVLATINIRLHDAIENKKKRVKEEFEKFTVNHESIFSEIKKE